MNTNMGTACDAIILYNDKYSGRAVVMKIAFIQEVLSHGFSS